MLERYFEITNFRSIGTESSTKFEINNVVDKKNTMGGVVTLIGENNSGKSNYLDVIKCFGNKRFEPRDIPHYNYDPEAKPVVTLFLRDVDSNTKLKAKMKDGKLYYDEYRDGKEVEQKIPTVLSEKSQDIIKYLTSQEFTQLCQSNNRMLRLKQSVDTILTKVDKLEKITNNEMVQFRTFLTSPYIQPHLHNKYNQNRWNEFSKEVEKSLMNSSVTGKLDVLNKTANKEFGLDLVPSIIEYNDKDKLSDSDIFSTVSGGVIHNKSFFVKLYNMIPDMDIAELENVYKKFAESGGRNKFHLTNYEKEINKALEKLSNQFNSVYTFDDSKKYLFKIDIESEKLFFIINEDGMDISLDSQSTGFKWFFNFFFSIFTDEGLKNGDIIIMDEPATNLHVGGQIELRKQIKEFGMANGITFIISTHSPFLIDPDYLDEIRLVKKDKQESKVYNKFTVNDDSDFDVLLPIKSALTVNRHILLNPDDTLIFVEGITDYNYLVAFKQYHKIENLTFMPIQGIKRANIHKELLKITKNPIILVDSDKAGLNFKEKSENQKVTEVYTLKDVDSKFIEIEDLFSKEDRDKYCNKKNYKLSSDFKNNIKKISRRISKETKENFKKLLDYLNA